MGFILDGLETESYDRKYRDADLLRRIVTYFFAHSRKVLFVAIALTINSAAGSGVPVAISRVIDVVAENPKISQMAIACGVVLALGTVAWITNFIHQWIAGRVIGDVVLKLREDVFASTVRHDMSFYEEHPSGKVVSRLTSDTQDFSNVVTLVMTLLSQVLILAILTVWLLSISPILTGYLYAMAPVAITIALSFRKIARRDHACPIHHERR